VKKRFSTRTAVMCAIAVTGWSLCVTASAQTITHIMAGTDYLQTRAGTAIKIPFPTGTITVPLKGVPIKGMGNVDTIIQREKDAIFGADDATGAQVANVTIQLMALNLQGSFTGSAGQACTVSITLGGTSTGTVVFNLGPPMTFTSSFTVNYVAVFSPSSCGGMITGSCKLNNKGTTGGGTWIAVPPSPVPTDPPYYLVQAAYPNPKANLHTPGSYPAGYVDFFITGLTSDAAQTAKHVVCEAASQVGGACPK